MPRIPFLTKYYERDTAEVVWSWLRFKLNETTLSDEAFEQYQRDFNSFTQICLDLNSRTVKKFCSQK